METVNRGVEQVACTILERLGNILIDAVLDYESFAGVHNFSINHGGTRFRVQFADQMLLRKSVEELEETIRKVAERVLCNSSVRPLQYRS